MADSAFVLADIDKLVQFEKKSEEAIKEFDAIKEKFNDINTTLLKTADLFFQERIYL